MTSKTTNKFSPEVRARGPYGAGSRGRTSVTLGGDHVDSGRKPGLTTDMAARLKALARNDRELRQANEILRKAPAYFA